MLRTRPWRAVWKGGLNSDSVGSISRLVEHIRRFRTRTNVIIKAYPLNGIRLRTGSFPVPRPCSMVQLK